MRKTVLFAIMLFFIACSYSGDTSHQVIDNDDFVFAELINGAVDIPSDLDGRLFLVLYNIPSVKFESTDVSLFEEEPNTLTVVGVPPQSDIQELRQAKHPTAETYLNNDSIHDKMRAIGHELLASGLRQYNDGKLRNAEPPNPKEEFIIGEIRKWYIIKEIPQQKELKETKCIGISDNAYFFAETDIVISLEYVEILKNEFESKYEFMHEYFGKENDVDNNGKIVIVIADVPEAFAGYFSPVDKYPKEDFPDSNEADIIYINSQYILDENMQSDAFMYLIHEFQHMIYFDNVYNKRPYSGNADQWLNEALSLLSEYVSGYISRDVFDPYIFEFLLGYRGQSLTNWTYYNYGYSSMFARYLYERFSIEVIKKIYSADTPGYRAVEIATGMDFNELYKDFVMACVLSGKGILDDKKYNFETIDFSLYFADKDINFFYWKMEAGKQRPANLKPYSFMLIEIEGTVDRVMSDNFSGAVFRIKP